MDITEDLKLAVWNKGRTLIGQQKEILRKDIFGSPIKFNQFGNRSNQYGWEIDHITPKDKGGSDNISNLQPLQWENNMKKSNKIIKPVVLKKLENRAQRLLLPKKKINLFDFSNIKN